MIKLSQAFSALGDHSTDIFSTVKNLAILVSALQDSTNLMRQLNQNLANVTGLLADNPNEVGDAVRDLNAAVGEVQSFVAENREALGTTSDKLAGVTQALTDSLDDIKQFLHVAPSTLQNYINIYQPAQGGASAVLAVDNFPNTITFSCAALCRRRRGWVPSSRRSCACSTWHRLSRPAIQLPADRPDIFIGAAARRMRSPTARSGWVRITFRPNRSHRRRLQRPRLRQILPPVATNTSPLAAGGPPLAAEAAATGGSPTATNPADGLTGLMVPPGVGP